MVIMNRKDYVQEGLRQLSDGKVYEKQRSDLTQTHFDKVKGVVNQMVDSKEITQKRVTTWYRIVTEPLNGICYLKYIKVSPTLLVALFAPALTVPQKKYHNSMILLFHPTSNSLDPMLRILTTF